MTITFRFFAALTPRTNGLAPISAVPNATPAALRKKSRLLRPSCVASSLLNDDWALNSVSPYDRPRMLCRRSQLSLSVPLSPV
jgi:hypothetical protein